MGRAVGMIETIGIATNIEATDLMLKTADVVVYRQNKTDPALVTTYIVGDVSAVKIAIEAGKQVAERTGALVAYSVIPAVDIKTDECLIK
ncbi:BMC domain-containing protein [Cytobacillus sp. FJAT-54145]|uniref:BMC domain-containing protein n=1 Tax=Cytobacillus spartinae TaxID=3299023 RepID=A0ABW6K9K9_9BACI